MVYLADWRLTDDRQRLRLDRLRLVRRRLERLSGEHRG
jgi:hypothetical protein